MTFCTQFNCVAFSHCQWYVLLQFYSLCEWLALCTCVQVWVFSPVWMSLWVLRFPAWLNDFLHSVHLCGFSPLWESMCQIISSQNVCTHCICLDSLQCVFWCDISWAKPWYGCAVPEIGSWINIPLLHWHRTMTLLQIQHSLYWSPRALGLRILKNGVKMAIYGSKMGRFFLYNIRIMRINAHLMHIGRYIRMANPTMECAL